MAYVAKSQPRGVKDVTTFFYHVFFFPGATMRGIVLQSPEGGDVQRLVRNERMMIRFALSRVAMRH